MSAPPFGLYRERTKANGDAVYTGHLYVSDGRVVISAIGLDVLTHVTGVAKTVTDLKTALTATTIKDCDAVERRHVFSNGLPIFDV